MKLYIARHGETEWNKAGRMQGWLNSSLTENGISNAKKLGESLKHVNFDLVYCSPLGRAVETATHILGDKQCTFVYQDSFKEMGFGSWEGMLHDDVKLKFTEQQHNFWNAPHLYKPVDGESYEVFIDRVNKGFGSIVQNSKCENALLVTHAAVIKAIFAIIYKSPLQDFWAPPFTYDTCLSILEIEDGSVRVLMEPDISHLD